MKSHFRDALHNARDVQDESIEQTFDQTNMVSEVLEGVRAIVREQVAEALPPPGQYNYQPAIIDTDAIRQYNYQSAIGGDVHVNPIS